MFFNPKYTTAKIIAVAVCACFLWQDVIWAGGDSFIRPVQLRQQADVGRDKKTPHGDATGFPSPAETGIKAVFFDLGGVIFKWDYLPVAEEISKYCQMSQDDILEILLSEEFMGFFERGMLKPHLYFRKLRDRLGLRDIGYSEFVKIFTDPRAYTLIPETVAVMRQLKDLGYKLFILSDTNKIHKSHLWARYFQNPESPLHGLIETEEYYITSYETGAMKKDGRRIFDKALKTAGVNDAWQAIFVDDRHEYLITASQTGFKTAHMKLKPEHEANIPQADLHKEMLQILSRSAQRTKIVSLLQQALYLIDAPEAEIILYGSVADERHRFPTDLDLAFTPALEPYKDRFGEFFNIIGDYLKSNGVELPINDGETVGSSISIEKIIEYKKTGKFFGPQGCVWLITRKSVERIGLEQAVADASAANAGGANVELPEILTPAHLPPFDPQALILKHNLPQKRPNENIVDYVAEYKGEEVIYAINIGPPDCGKQCAFLNVSHFLKDEGLIYQIEDEEGNVKYYFHSRDVLENEGLPVILLPGQAQVLKLVALSDKKILKALAFAEDALVNGTLNELLAIVNAIANSGYLRDVEDLLRVRHELLRQKVEVLTSKPEDADWRVEFIKEIDKGTFGTVCIVRIVRDGRMAALKITGGEFCEKELMEMLAKPNIAREVATLNKYRDTGYVPELYHVYTDKNGQPAAVLMELIHTEDKVVVAKELYEAVTAGNISPEAAEEAIVSMLESFRERGDEQDDPQPSCIRYAPTRENGKFVLVDTGLLVPIDGGELADPIKYENYVQKALEKILRPDVSRGAKAAANGYVLMEPARAAGTGILETNL